MHGPGINDIKTGFTGTCHEAGILNLTFHDLRHTRSTRAAESGVPESVRRDILGHFSPTMTGDYTHTSPEVMEKGMELVADYSGEKIFSLTAKSWQAAESTLSASLLYPQPVARQEEVGSRRET